MRNRSAPHTAGPQECPRAVKSKRYRVLSVKGLLLGAAVDTLANVAGVQRNWKKCHC